MKRTLISDCYENAREFLAKANKYKEESVVISEETRVESDKREALIQDWKNKARDEADKGIVFLSENVQKNGLKDTDIIEGFQVRLWYDRFWLFLELNGLMLDDDENHKPEENYFWDKMAGVELDG